MIKRIIIACLFALVFGLVFQTYAQSKEFGAYILYAGNQKISEENFASEKLPDGSVKTVSKTGTTVYTTVTKNDKPLEFSIETNGTPILMMNYVAGEAKYIIAGQPEKTVKTAGTVVLENGVWSQFVNLVAQYDEKKGGVQNFVGLLPSQTLDFPMTLEKAETKDFKVNGQIISISKYRLVNTQSALKADVWADKSGVPLLIELSAPQIQVVKGGFEELRGLTAPPKTQLRNFTGEFTAEEVSFPNGDVTLAGTLTLPKNGKKMFPAVVIITGSGSQERDGSTLFNLYKQIAESLSKAGIAVLRVDDRGAGKSTIVLQKAAETSYRDLISDSRRAFDYLMTRKEIDKTKIGLVGHSEGATTALTIAAEDERIAAVVLMAGGSRPVNEIIIEQELYQRAWQETADVSDKTKIPLIVQNITKGFEDAKLPQNANNAKLAWFRDHLAVNPPQLAAKVKCPVLILQGERDALVLAYHSVELAKALSNGGNKNISLRILPNLTHIFTPISGDSQESSKVSEEMLKTLQNWAFATLIEQKN